MHAQQAKGQEFVTMAAEVKAPALSNAHAGLLGEVQKAKGTGEAGRETPVPLSRERGGELTADRAAALPKLSAPWTQESPAKPHRAVSRSSVACPVGWYWTIS